MFYHMKSFQKEKCKPDLLLKYIYEDRTQRDAQKVAYGMLLTTAGCSRWCTAGVHGLSRALAGFLCQPSQGFAQHLLLCSLQQPQQGSTRPDFSRGCPFAGLSGDSGPAHAVCKSNSVSRKGLACTSGRWFLPEHMSRKLCREWQLHQLTSSLGRIAEMARKPGLPILQTTCWSCKTID